MTTPVFYARPEGAGRVLSVAPALASWERSGSPGQSRSATFITGVRTAVEEELQATPDPLALRLDVALPETVPLLAFNDLDNYLFPLIPALTAVTGRQFASVWATKRRGTTSKIEVSQARRIHDAGWKHSFQVRTTASASSTAYKQQIRDQIADGQSLPDGPVELQLAFVVGPRRAWPNLWKATIDALGSLLGRDANAREWNARDGRITDLGVHCTVNRGVGNDVVIAIRARAADQQTIH